MRKNSKILSKADPEGAKEWDYEKNEKLGLHPDKITFRSSKKAWWICPLGHSYESTVNHHTTGCRCPYCANKKVRTGFNDLKTLKPESLKEWDYERNEKLGITPKNITSKSKKKVWWKCSKEHSYIASVDNHTAGKRCPKCLESKGESTIEKFLKKYNILYERQFKFEDCKNTRKLPFDFAIFDREKIPILMVEYDGEQHFKPIPFGGISQKEAEENYKKTKTNDGIKNKYCKKNNIPLLRISYENFNRIEEILFEILKEYKIIINT